MLQLATLLATLLVTLLFLARPTCAHSADTPADDLTSLAILASPARLTVMRPGAASAYTPLHKRATQAVHADDHLRVTLDAYNATFVLHLAPDTHLVHPDAVVEVVKDGKTVTKPLRARVYAGHVVAQGAADDEGMVWTATGKGHGRARLVLYHDGLTDDPEYAQHYTSTRVPIFAAEWTALGDTYRADPIHAYLRHKRPHDPVVPASRHLRARDPRLADATMVLYRDSDTVGARSQQQQQHLLKRRDDLAVPTGECGNMQFGAWNRAFRAQWAADRAERTVTRLRSRAPSPNCPTDPSFVYMGVAADCSYTATFKGSEKDVINELITVWGTVSSKYQDTFNVGVGIVRTVLRMDCGGAEPWNRDCSTTSYQISDRLSDFSKWRGDQKTDEGLWHLLSKCNTGATLGIAWTGTLCETSTRDQPKSATPGSGSSQLSAISSGSGGEREYVTGAGVSTITRDQWKVVAHEIGHNFGAIHDCIASQCSAGAQDCSPCTSAGNGTSTCDCAGRFLMNPTDNSATNQFSPGSIDDICRHVTKVAKSMGTKSCLLKPGARKLLQGNVCGNGVLEEGEECDCGDRCAQDACCTAQCKLKPNAQCSDRNSPGCCAQCKFKPAGAVCRAAHEFCDVAETCPGNSAECPKDTYLPDGTACTLNGTVPAESAANSYCASGLCTNRDAQCFLASKGQATVFRTACAPRQGECQITCQVGNATNQCSEFNAVFLDGTDCGLGGRCQAGQCSGSSILNSVSGWIKGNPTLAYVVAAAIGLAVLMCAWSCVLRPAADKCCRRAGKKKVPVPPPPTPTTRPSNTAAPVASVAAAAGAASTAPATAAPGGAPSPAWPRPSPTAPQGPPGYPQPPMASAPPQPPPGYPQPPPVAPVPVTGDASDASSGYSASRPMGRPYENAPRPPYDTPRPFESSTRPYEFPARPYENSTRPLDASRPSESPTRPYDASRPSGTSPRLYDAPRPSPYETRRPSETSAWGYETSRPNYDASPRLGYGAPLQQPPQPYGDTSRLPPPRPGGSGPRSGSVPRGAGGGGGYGWKPS